VPDPDLFPLGDFVLQSGATLWKAGVAYKTYGSLNAARDNVVLIPTFYAGQHTDCELMFAAGRAIDPARHFIVVANMLGNGLSSSPSNTPAPFEGGRFPKITLYDNVKLQQKLVREELGVERLKLVTGFSMGACQAFEWAAQFPDMVQAAAPLAGSARTGSFNKVFLLSLRRALELDPVFADGFYERPPVRGLKAFAAIYAGWGFSEPFYRTAAYRQFNARNHEEFVEYFWEPFFLRCDANNLLSQLWTWLHSDISDNPTYGGDFERALGAIKARTIIVPSELDRYFPPVDSENEARQIPGASWRQIPSIWGHMALFNPADGAFIDQALKELLG